MSEIFMIDENICRQVLSLKLTPDAVAEELHKKVFILPILVNIRMLLNEYGMQSAGQPVLPVWQQVLSWGF
ncbi:MAG: hypothetical protein IPI88_15175 [Chitinophagaceae bacterium]|nr:hypothetical protein [Chitinophagaceae bacterium]